MVPAAFAGPDQAKPAAPSASPHVQSSRPRRCRGSSSLNCRLDFEHNPLPAAVCSKRATWSPVPAQREASAPSALSSVRACTDHSLRKRWRSSRPPEHQERDWWHSVCWIKTAVEIPQPSGLGSRAMASTSGGDACNYLEKLVALKRTRLTGEIVTISAARGLRPSAAISPSSSPGPRSESTTSSPSLV